MKKAYVFAVIIMVVLLLAGCGSIYKGFSSAVTKDDEEEDTAKFKAYPETMYLNVGEEDTIQVSGERAKNLIFTSSRRSVAKVDDDGNVTALKAGKCTITVASESNTDNVCYVEVIVEEDEEEKETSAKEKPEAPKETAAPSQEGSPQSQDPSGQTQVTGVQPLDTSGSSSQQSESQPQQQQPQQDGSQGDNSQQQQQPQQPQQDGSQGNDSQQQQQPQQPQQDGSQGNDSQQQQQQPAEEEKPEVDYVEEKDPTRVYPTYVLSDDEINAMDAEQTQFVINQIYAKNGYIFKTKSILDYFESMPWYSPQYKEVNWNSMSQTDQKNLNKLVAYRDGLRGNPSDLGYLWTYRAVSGPLDENFVRNLSKYDIQLLINTIYAKNGYIFESREIQRFFEGQPWYNGITRDMGAVKFTDGDRRNINLLLKYR